MQASWAASAASGRMASGLSPAAVPGQAVPKPPTSGGSAVLLKRAVSESRSTSGSSNSRLCNGTSGGTSIAERRKMIPGRFSHRQGNDRNSSKSDGFALPCSSTSSLASPHSHLPRRALLMHSRHSEMNLTGCEAFSPASSLASPTTHDYGSPSSLPSLSPPPRVRGSSFLTPRALSDSRGRSSSSSYGVGIGSSSSCGVGIGSSSPYSAANGGYRSMATSLPNCNGSGSGFKPLGAAACSAAPAGRGRGMRTGPGPSFLAPNRGTGSITSPTNSFGALAMAGSSASLRASTLNASDPANSAVTPNVPDPSVTAGMVTTSGAMMSPLSPL